MINYNIEIAKLIDKAIENKNINIQELYLIMFIDTYNLKEDDFSLDFKIIHNINYISIEIKKTTNIEYVNFWITCNSMVEAVMQIELYIEQLQKFYSNKRI